MKITRKQLRKMINESIIREHKIKPDIKGASDHDVGKIDSLARGHDTWQQMADILANTKPRRYSGSYSADLADYDNIVPLTMTVLISKFPSTPDDQSFQLQLVVPNELVDEVIEEYNAIQSYNVSGLIVAVRKVEEHLMRSISYHYPDHVIDEFTSDISGYRAEEYRRAWYEAMEYYSVGGF